MEYMLCISSVKKIVYSPLTVCNTTAASSLKAVTLLGFVMFMRFCLFVRIPYNTVALYLPELFLLLLEEHLNKITKLGCSNHKFSIHKGQT